MNEDARGTVRRSAEGALVVRDFRGDELGWTLVLVTSVAALMLSKSAGL
jgi:hypothetical protein